MEWCREKVICLISLFEERPCLWDKTHKYYRDRDTKNAAMLEISERLGLSCIEVERKLNTLLTQYRREKHVQRKMELAGCAIKKPWFGYGLLRFLETADNRTVISSWPKFDMDCGALALSLNRMENSSCADFKNSQQNAGYKLDQASDDVSVANEPAIVMEQELPISETFPRPLRESRKRKHSPDRGRTKIGQAYRVLKAAYKDIQNRDDLKIFAEGVETRLRNIQNRKKVCILKHQIETLLFTAEMEELSQISPTSGTSGVNGEHSFSCKTAADENAKNS